ncbi:protein LURP-one-related 10-like [Lolium perenne]|uniref:protein LURP-one-related 10-like n=1 Tax=Lolium perenne TaxID=4522 RepID=UPI0021F5E7FF|nr:protein LURP-one-related 10-like [Lolium perenne]
MDTVTTDNGNAAAPVVDARYCAPHATAFKVTDTFSNGFSVTDADGAQAMRAEKAVLSWFRRHLLVDVSAAPRRPVLTVQRWPTVFEIYRTWEVYTGDSTRRTDLLFIAVAQPSIFGVGDVHVHLAGHGGRDPADFVVRSGGFFSSDYTVSRSRDGTVVAQIQRTGGLLDLLINSLQYRVSINAGVDQAFVLALTVILAEIRHDDRDNDNDVCR